MISFPISNVIKYVSNKKDLLKKLNSYCCLTDPFQFSTNISFLKLAAKYGEKIVLVTKIQNRQPKSRFFRLNKKILAFIQQFQQSCSSIVIFLV